MRRTRGRGSWLAALTLALSLLVVPVADAYIDPGSGSFIFQAIVGGLMAAGLGIKVFWRRIVSFFTRKRSQAGP